jgi:hypothetical protein
MGFYDLKASGPMVVEIPPAREEGSLNGNFVTLWQTALEDAGLLGVDKGQGVKFVITPPGYDRKIPDGFEQLASDTYGGYFLIRSSLKSHSDADVQKSIAYGKRVKFYPLSEAGKKPETVFIDVKDKDFDSTIKYDASYFALLDRVVQAEPWIPRDRAMIDQLRTIGIEKGKPFAPDDAMQKALEGGVAEAKALLAARYDAGLPAFFEGTHWTLPEVIEGQSTDYADPNAARRGEGAAVARGHCRKLDRTLAQRCGEARRPCCGRFADSSAGGAGMALLRTRMGLSSLFEMIGGARRLISVDWMIEVVVIA